MKNADVIRSMTDKQLDEFLAQFEIGDIDYAVTFCDLCNGNGNELGLDCDGCRAHWLTEDTSAYNGLNGWMRHNGFEPYREDGE